MTALTVTGASDDLIEIDGGVREELTLHSDDDGDLLAFSDGTILRITYTKTGVWRIVPVVRGNATIEIEQAPEDDEDNYTDTATLDFGGMAIWVVHGIGMAV